MVMLKCLLLLMLILPYSIVDSASPNKKGKPKPEKTVQLRLVIDPTNCPGSSSTGDHFNLDTVSLVYTEKKAGQLSRIKKIVTIHPGDKSGNDVQNVNFHSSINVSTSISIPSDSNVAVIIRVSVNDLAMDNAISYRYNPHIMFLRQMTKDTNSVLSNLHVDPFRVYPFMFSAVEYYVDGKLIFHTIAKKEDCSNPNYWIANHGIYRLQPFKKTGTDGVVSYSTFKWTNLYYEPETESILT